jgi:hypothetical protein
MPRHCRITLGDRSESQRIEVRASYIAKHRNARLHLIGCCVAPGIFKEVPDAVTENGGGSPPRLGDPHTTTRG